jgi:hypothetical protein
MPLYKTQEGIVEYRPTELPSDYVTGADPENPFVRIVATKIKIKRICNQCGNAFELHVEYDPENEAHNLCDDCLINRAIDPNQKYPEETIQIQQGKGQTVSEEPEEDTAGSGV